MEHDAQPQPMPHDPSQGMVNHPYVFYPQDGQHAHDEQQQQQQHQQQQHQQVHQQQQQQQHYALAYPPQQMQPYPILHPAAPARSLSTTDLQAMSFRGVNMQQQQPYAQPPIYPATSPPHVGMPISASPPPPSPYDPLSPPGSDTSGGEGLYHTHSRDSSVTGSPVSSRPTSFINHHRHALRYNPTPSPSGSSGRRSRDHSVSDDEDRMGVTVAESLSSTRKEATRKQRIEAEQRRRDELRDGYSKLKDALPLSNQKSSKVSLLERARMHIIQLEDHNKQLLARLAELEREVGRLRVLNEKITLGVDVDATMSEHTPAAHPIDSRPLSPPPDVPPSSQNHALTSVSGQNVPVEESSGSEA